MKQEKIREKQLAEQREARRAKNTIRKEKRVAKKLEQMGAIAAPAKAAPAKEEKKPAAPAKEEKKPAAAPKQEKAAPAK
jgi:hypothetical protein